MVAGDHVPVTGVALVDDVFKTGGVAPIHNVGTVANVGVIGAVTTTFIVTVPAHCEPVGVKVYVVVPTADVLIVAGDHVPVTGVEFVEDVFKEGGVLPAHKVGIALNVGVTAGVIFTCTVSTNEQLPVFTFTR